MKPSAGTLWVELIHTQPGIRNVVPSLDDLGKNLPMTIIARGDTPGSVVKVTYTVTEVRRLRAHLTGPAEEAVEGQKRFFNAVVDILKDRGIKPPESLLAQMSSLGMSLPK